MIFSSWELIPLFGAMLLIPPTQIPKKQTSLAKRSRNFSPLKENMYTKNISESWGTLSPGIAKRPGKSKHEPLRESHVYAT